MKVTASSQFTALIQLQEFVFFSGVALVSN